jgi:hypothetical protein
MLKKTFTSMKKGKSKRLRGGPFLPLEDAIYFEREMQRIAQVEGLSNCSFPTILRRIARGRLDLTQAGVDRYTALDEKRDLDTEPVAAVAGAYN